MGPAPLTKLKRPPPPKDGEPVLPSWGLHKSLHPPWSCFLICNRGQHARPQQIRVRRQSVTFRSSPVSLCPVLTWGHMRHWTAAALCEG